MAESPSTDPEAVVSVSRPWLGLLPFTEANRGFFFGRDAEILEIQERIQENLLTTLFGQSGLGKTSLLGAGVVPRLRECGMSPVLLRLDHDPMALSPLDQTRAALRQALSGLEWPADAAAIPLWELLHRLPALLGPDHPTPVLIFDQFEEIFTLGQQDPAQEARAAEWLEQIADLIQGRPPKALELRFAGNRRLARDYDFGRCPVHFVFSLREDYLSHLEEWKGTLPLLVQNRMRLCPLDGTQALDAVMGPASLGHPPLLSREVAALIVRTVARVSPDTPLSRIRAVPPLLSLLCEQLNSARLKAGAERIDAPTVTERSQDILHQFYEESFAAFPDEDRERIRAVVEDRMVTVGGHRHPVAREDAEAELAGLGVPEAPRIFDSLIHRRLLTAEETGGLQRLEITHDVLLPLILRSRKERRDRQEREAFERRVEEENAKARLRRRVVSGMAFLTLLACIFALLAWRSSRQATALAIEKALLEGLGWLQRAIVSSRDTKHYPEALILAAKSIGFDGSGRPARGAPLPLIRPETADAAYRQASGLIAGQPAYVPVWIANLSGKAISMDVGPDGRLLAAGSDSGELALWDFSTGSRLDLSPSPRIEDLAFHSDGRQLAVAFGSSVRTWKHGIGWTGNIIAAQTNAIARHPAGDLLITAEAEGNLVCRRGDQEPVVIPGPGVPALRMDMASLRSVAVGAFPGEGVRVFFPAVNASGYSWPPDPESTSDPARIPGRNVTAVTISPDGRTLAYGTDEGHVWVWDVLRVAPVRKSPDNLAHGGAVHDLRFRDDGRQIASACDDGCVRLWENEGDDLVLSAALLAHKGPVHRVRYGPPGNLLFSCGADGAVKLWDVSGVPRPGVDLYAYLRDDWYRIDGEGKLVIGDIATASANVPAGTFVDAWRSDPAGLARTLRASQARAGVIAMLPDLDASLRKELGTDLSSAMLQEAADAMDSLDVDRAEILMARQAATGVAAADSVDALTGRIQQLARTGKPFTNSRGMELAWCPAGTFEMGSPDGRGDRPAERGRAKRGEVLHRVILSHGFWMGRREVTQAEWTAVMESNPSVLTNAGPEAPVENISWHQAMEFCRRLTDRERFQGLVPAGWEYSLPTHAQWQYACRAETTDAYNFGADRDELFRHGNYRDEAYGKSSGAPRPAKNQMTPEDYLTDWDRSDGHALTAPAGSYQPNRWGFFDMHGNVSEWCLDHFEMDNPGHVQPDEEKPKRTDPYLGPSADRLDRKVAGGSWSDSRNDNRSAKSVALRATTRKWTIGMRVVLVPVRSP